MWRAIKLWLLDDCTCSMHDCMLYDSMQIDVRGCDILTMSFTRHAAYTTKAGSTVWLGYLLRSAMGNTLSRRQCEGQYGARTG